MAMPRGRYNRCMSAPHPPPPGRHREAFATTRWSVVMHAGKRGSPDAGQALEFLCATYWPPLYAYARRRAGNLHEAQDMTQEFFAALLEKNYMAAAAPQRGRFRSYLLTAFKHFLAKQWRRAKARKRGGGRPHVRLNFANLDAQWGIEPATTLTPEQIYDRQWAIALLERVLGRLRQEYADAGRGNQFDALRSHLVGAQAEGSFAELAPLLGVTAAAAKKAASRLRARYRQLLREEIAETVAAPGEIEDEIRSLFQILKQ